MNTAWINRMLRLLGIFLLILLLLKSDLRALAATLSRLHIPSLALVFCISFIPILFRALRFRSLVVHSGTQLSLWKSFVYYYMGVVLRAFTPGSIGDFVKIFYLKEHGVSFVSGFAMSIVDRFCDFVVLVVIGVFSLFFVSRLGILVPTWYPLALAFILICCSALLYQRRLGKIILRAVYSYIVPLRFKEQALQAYHKLQHHLCQLPYSAYISVAGYTLLSWAVYFYQMYLLAQITGIDLVFFDIVIITTFTNFAVLLPITIAGVGTREATLIGLLGLVGIGWEHALAYSLLMLASNLFVGVFGCILWLFYPVKFSSSHANASSQQNSKN